MIYALKCFPSLLHVQNNNVSLGEEGLARISHQWRGIECPSQRLDATDHLSRSVCCTLTAERSFHADEIDP